MKRDRSLRARVAMLCGAILFAFAGCATDPSAPEAATGSLSLDLTVAEGFEIDEVTWTISGGDMADMSGTIDTSAPGSTASVEVFGLPEGDFTITLEATATDGETTCGGSAPFSIDPPGLTETDVLLRCKLPPRLGGVRVNGEINICAELTKAVVSPLQTSVGGSIDLRSEAVDEEGDAVEYLWTSGSGEIDDPTAADTTYTCTGVGDDQIIITVSDDGFDHCVSDWTVPVTCVSEGTIVFVSERTGNDELYAMNSDGTDVEQLTDQPGPDQAPTWDFAGERLVFQSRRAPHDDQTELYRFDFAAGETTRITDDPLDDQRGSWTPDGSSVVFQRGTFFTGFGLWGHELATGNEELVISFPDSISAAPSVSPDGTTLAFQSNHESTGIFPFRLYTLDLITLEVDPFFHAATGSDDGPRWSPDGTRIAFSSSRGDSSSLYVADLATGQLEQVTDDDGWDISPAWSPDGTRLVFQSDRVIEEGDVHVVDLRSGELSYLGEGRTPVWSSFDRNDDGD